MNPRRGTTRCQTGMMTAEYAVGTVAACACACLLLQLLPNWRGVLIEILSKILEVRFGPIFRLPL